MSLTLRGGAALVARARALRSLPATIALIVIGVTPGALRAQASPDESDEWRTKAWMGDVAFAGANALVAGVTAGLIQELRNGSFRDGFARGALGGAIAYGGRRVAAERFQGAGLIGRQVSAVGISIARNAGDNQPMLRQIWLPLGPVTVKLDRTEKLSVSARADVFASAWLLAAILDSRLDFDAAESLSSGAPVFRAPDYRLRRSDRSVAGTAMGGVVVVAHHSDELRTEQILAHERVHVLQYDFAQLQWGDPLEKRLGEYVPYVDWAQRYVGVRTILPLLATGFGRFVSITGRSTIWELEAHYLEGR